MRICNDRMQAIILYALVIELIACLAAVAINKAATSRIDNVMHLKAIYFNS